MDLLWPILKARKETKNALLFGCNSHGLQFLVEDILSLPSVNKTFKNAELILEHFYSAPLQISILRNIQLRESEQVRPLLGSMLHGKISRCFMAR